MQPRRYILRAWFLVAGWTLLVGAIAEAGTVFLPTNEYVRRLSLDLKGTLPTVAETGTPEAGLPALIDQYLASDEFSQRMMWLANDIFLTRTSEVEYFRDSYEYSEEEVRWDVTKSVGEEPLRLFQYIVANDLPLTELVTADYTVADSTLAWFWNLDYPGEYYDTPWLKSRYTDGREHAGVLSQNGFYYRYPTTISNKQRHRANTLTRIFLDDDHLLRDVSVDLRLGAADPNLDLLDATLHNIGCTACHNTLDGIGSHLFGFSVGPDGSSQYARDTFGIFSKQGMQRAQMQVKREPGFYGYPSRGFKDLGAYIAADPRFAKTMVKHFYRFFQQRNVDYRDRDLLIGLAEGFKASGYNARSLTKAIVQSEEYRAVGYSDGTKAEEFAPDPLLLKDLAKPWRDLETQIASAKVDVPSKEEWLETIRLHAMETGYSQREALGFAPSLDKGTNPTEVLPIPPAELIQPFKLITPEQMNTLGRALVGEIWNGYEGGQWMPPPFPHLEYNTDVKVAAGGYDGRRILTRRFDVPPTYLLVLERWAEVIAEDALERELGESVPAGQRIVFTVITGKEEPVEAEPAIRSQVVDWFRRFYGEDVAPNSPEVDEVFGVLLLAREEAREMFGNWYSIEVGWSHVLGMMLSDPRMAMY